MVAEKTNGEGNWRVSNIAFPSPSRSIKSLSTDIGVNLIDVSFLFLLMVSKQKQIIFIWPVLFFEMILKYYMTGGTAVAAAISLSAASKAERL